MIIILYIIFCRFGSFYVSIRLHNRGVCQDIVIFFDITMFL